MSFTEFPNNSGSKYSETKLKYSKDITMEFFSLTKSGEAINISEFALILWKRVNIVIPCHLQNGGTFVGRH